MTDILTVRRSSSLVFAAPIALVATFSATRVVNAQTYTYNFDAGYTDFQSHFAEGTQGSVNSSWSSLQTSGIGGSEAIREPGNIYAAGIYRVGFANVAGSTITSSMFFKVNALQTQNGGGSDSVGMGLLTSLNGYWDRYDQTSGANYNLINLNRETDTQTYIYNEAADSGGPQSTTGQRFFQGLTAGDWYKMTTTFVNTGSGFSSSASVDDYGTSGTLFQGNLYSYAPQTLNVDYTSPILYIGMYGGTLGGEVGGAQAIDNFSVTYTSAATTGAEPGALALLLPISLPALAGVARRHRKSNAPSNCTEAA